MPWIEKLLQFGQEGLANFCCGNSGNFQNSGKQRLFFILKKFLDLNQYNPDTVSNPTELTEVFQNLTQPSI